MHFGRVNSLKLIIFVFILIKKIEKFIFFPLFLDAVFMT